MASPATAWSTSTTFTRSPSPSSGAEWSRSPKAVWARRAASSTTLWVAEASYAGLSIGPVSVAGPSAAARADRGGQRASTRASTRASSAALGGSRLGHPGDAQPRLGADPGKPRRVADRGAAGVVVEEGEGLGAGAPQRAQAIRPVFEHGVRVGPSRPAAPMESQVTPFRGGPLGLLGLPVAIGEAEGGIAVAEHLGDLVPEPRGVAHLDGDADASRHRRQRVAQPRRLGLEVRRELEQHRAHPIAEAGGTAEKGLDRVAHLSQPPDVADIPGELEGKEEPRRHTLPPLGEDILGGEAVEGVVDLHASEGRRVVLEPQPLRQPLRVDAAPPVAVLPPGGADPDGHGALAWTRQGATCAD